MTSELFSPLLLRSGQVLKNRIAKAAMEENMAAQGQLPGDQDAPLEPFADWAKVGKSGGGAIWMQINHPGRQVASDMPGVVWGPSDVGVSLGKHSSRFGRPTAMTQKQIEDTVTRFAVTAHRAEQAVFD
ncbi:2,4-dienoyl-CoA reductase, partial [Streptomyces sp. NPDC058321]